MSFAILIPLGPGRAELQRLGDLLEAVLHFEPTCTAAVIINDGNDKEAARNVAGQFPVRCEILANPRNGRGSWWGGGSSAGTICGLRWITNHLEPEFVVKLDSDSLVIGHFKEALSQFFHANPTAALAGSHRRNPEGTPRDGLPFAPAIQKLQRRFTVWRKCPLLGRNIQFGWFGRSRKIRELILSAVNNGYEFGENCQGGAYAISVAGLNAFAKWGLLDDPLLFLNTPITEDVALGLFTRSLGMELRDFNHPGETFAVRHFGLSAPPAELLTNGYSIVHSIKNRGESTEEGFRTFFRTKRNGK